MIGFYDLGSRAGIVVRSIAGSLLVAMVPFGTQLHERAGREGLGRLYRIGVKYSALCLLPVTALALYHSRALIEAWLPGAPGADMVLFVFRVSLAAHALLGVSGPIAMVGRSAGVPATEAVTQSLAGAAGLALAAITAGAEGSVAVFTGAAAVGGMVLWGLLAARLSLPGAPVLRDLAATLAVALVTFVSVLAADYALPGMAASQGGLAILARVALTSAASLPAGLGMVWLWGGLKRD
jgi:O-antigen/teichoic acid export membrane protein